MKTEQLNRNLADHARMTARTLHVPFVSITLPDHGKASYIDGRWAARHPDVDCAGLGGPSSTAAKILPFFAAVPIRNDVGVPVGYLSCGDSLARDLSDDELGVLKDVATDIAAQIDAVAALGLN